jgi:imidazolonepropionase-like amidohydrolase
MRITSQLRLTIGVGAAALLVITLRVAAEAPYVYAIKGAHVVTAAGSPIASGTVVIRNGLIDAVGADVQPPSDAVVIDGAGLTVYPGLIDMGSSAGLDIQVPTQQPQTIRTTDEAERWKRSVMLRADVSAAEHVKLDAPELSRLASAGITTVLATPPGVLIKGQSALINVATPEEEPIVGAVAEPRAGVNVVRTPVALHVEFQNPRGDVYPVALLGAIAFVRQSFIDAQYQQMLEQRYRKSPAGMLRPPFEPALEAMQPALAARMPVAFEANLGREVLRALNLAKEFKLDPIVTGGHEADLVAADLAAQRARVIYSLNFPTRPKTLAPDADEPARELRLRAHVAKAPAALAKAGIPFAFSSSGLTDPRDFLRNAAKTVKEGLADDAALRALTIEAAKIAGAGDRVGSIEKGKAANLVVADGDLFNDRTKIRNVFVDGRRVNLEALNENPSRGRGRSGGPGF